MIILSKFVNSDVKSTSRWLCIDDRVNVSCMVNQLVHSIQFNSIYSKTDDRSPKGLVCQTRKIRLVLHNVFTILGKNIFTKVQYPLHIST